MNVPKCVHGVEWNKCWCHARRVFKEPLIRDVGDVRPRRIVLSLDPGDDGRGAWVLVLLCTGGTFVVLASGNDPGGLSCPVGARCAMVRPMGAQAVQRGEIPRGRTATGHLSAWVPYFLLNGCAALDEGACWPIVALLMLGSVLSLLAAHWARKD